VSGLRPHLDARERPIGLFKPNPDNPRAITDEKFEALVESLRTMPWLMRARPLIARPDGKVIAGNMRLRAARALEWPKVWAVVVADEIPDDDVEKLVALVDNNPFGVYDETLLAEWVYDLSERDVDLSLTGFDDSYVRRVLASVAGPEPEPHPPSGHVDYQCPQCGFGWAGHPRPRDATGAAP